MRRLLRGPSPRPRVYTCTYLGDVALAEEPRPKIPGESGSEFAHLNSWDIVKSLISSFTLNVAVLE